MTHAPEPLSKDASYALSWEAATKRLEAAGSIPEREAELVTNAFTSNDAGIEVRKEVFTLIEFTVYERNVLTTISIDSITFTH